MIDVTGKDIDLNDLEKKLDAASVFHRGLGISHDILHTYEDNGDIAPLAEAAKPIVAAYTKPQPVAQPDMNSDVPIDNATVTQIVSSLRTYLQTPNASLTALNNAQALKALIRLVFFIFKRLVVLQ